MRPAGVNYSVIEHDPVTGRLGKTLFSPSYETGSHEKTAELMGSQIDLLKKRGGVHSIHGSVNYDMNDVTRARQTEAQSRISADNRLNPDHPDYVHSGVGRLLIESQHHDAAEKAISQHQPFILHRL
jgi:hypothetical protein